MKFKDEEENPYDSEEKDYDKNLKAEEEFENEEVENSYDSELEEEFFGKKDPEGNEQRGDRKVEKQQ